MLFGSIALLATLVPALAGHAQPAHLRHRHLAVRQSEQDHAGALAARANSAHADAHRVIKRTVNKRGQVCRPRGQSQPTFSSAASSAAAPTSAAPSPSSAAPPPPPAPSSSADPAPSPASQAAAWSQPSPSSSAAPAPAPSPSASDNQGGNNNNSNNGGNWNVLAVTDPACGWSGADEANPNGSEEWLNCGVTGSGWTPPHISIDQLIAAQLDDTGVFAPCSAYIAKFQQYGGEFDVHPIMLASFAMQESTCNAGAVGGNGEAGLMQIAPPNCEAGQNCWDVDYNIRRGAQLFRQMIDANGGNVLAAIGAYNGWTLGMTVASATAAKAQGHCFAQNNLDYLFQYCNGWMQNKNAHSMGSYHNLAGC